MARPTQQESERKRQAILKAAIGAFRDHGYAATSMDQIAASAQVSKRTVYNHFPSKDSLFEHILETLWTSGNESVDLPYRSDQPLDVALTQLINACIDLYSEAHFLDLARVAIAELVHTPQRAQHILARMDMQESGLTRWIRAASEDEKLVALDPSFAGQQLQALIKGFAFWPQVTLGHRPLPADERQHLVGSISSMFLNQYAAAKAR